MNHFWHIDNMSYSLVLERFFSLWFLAVWLWHAYSFYAHPHLGFTESFHSVIYIFQQIENLLFILSCLVFSFLCFWDPSCIYAGNLDTVSQVHKALFTLVFKFFLDLSPYLMIPCFVNSILLLSAYVFHILNFSFLSYHLRLFIVSVFWWNFSYIYLLRAYFSLWHWK